MQYHGDSLLDFVLLAISGFCSSVVVLPRTDSALVHLESTLVCVQSSHRTFF